MGGMNGETFRVRISLVAAAGLLAGASAVAGSGALAGATARRPAAIVPQLPVAFTDPVVAAVPSPVALAETPDGRMLVADQSGRVRVIKNGSLLTRPALDISTTVCSNSERSLLGVAVEPNFAVDGYVYVYYTFEKFAGCNTFVNIPVNRVSRFTMVGDIMKKPTETILIDEMPSYAGNHNAGFVGFGHDGMLYISVGDGGCDYTGVTGCAADNGISRHDNTPLGKVLRITPSGGIPADNPFLGAGTARCNRGAIADGMKCRETY